MSSTGREMPEGSLRVEHEGAVTTVTVDRARKRNALDDATILAIEKAFRTLPETTGAVVLAGEGDHFCAGLDLATMSERDVAGGIAHSRMWHRVFEQIEFGRVPVFAALSGAVIGGGLELAAAAHVRVSDTSTFYALPEGQRGIYVGGGASVRLPRLIGVARMRDMMLTGRTYGAEEGSAIGLAQYVVGPGEALAKAKELARIAAGNAPLTNLALIHVLPRIAESDPAAGYMAESLMAAIAQSDPEAKRRMAEFVAGRAARVRPG